MSEQSDTTIAVTGVGDAGQAVDDVPSDTTMEADGGTVWFQ